jgi:hypothetical protein
VAGARAQEAETALETALGLFQKGHWETSRDLLEALMGQDELQGNERTQARKYLGICYILFEEHAKAKSIFKRIIRDTPSFGIDTNDLRTQEGELIDEVVRVFSQGIMEVRREEIQTRQEQLNRTSRLNALVRSAALPGWGQRYQGYAQRGYWMLGAATASIAYAVVTERAFRQERRAYRTDDPEVDFERRYQDAKDSSRRANLAWRLLGAVWLLNMIDAGSQGSNIQNAQGFSLAPQGDAGIQLVLQTRF